MTPTLAVVTATVVGLMVGVELAVAVVVNPVLLRLPPDAALAARADSGRLLGRTMPFWYVGALLSTAALCVATWGSTSSVVAAAAVVLLAASVVMSVTLLVPINNRSRTWTAENYPPDWREQHRRWDRLHHVRVAVLTAAFVLVVVAATGR
ncbi:DUF1772 domain-containing protein [Prauserella rugosa]|uniref:Putative membrane protein n=1 Tax=Prauserella rugosa TaxID=43354 RepID=A0A660CIB0_9PSEU|nr:DUF1772 domain-containing protein [Prauserella rugosa]TWH20665.1 putative membrane protein [Prauserella rugosa]